MMRTRPGDREPSKDRRNRQTLSTILKWVGAATAIIAFFQGMYWIREVIEAWHEKREAVEELLGAAKREKEVGEYAHAWESCEKALAIDPASRSAFDTEVALAMKWLRTFVGEDPESVHVAEQVLPALDRGATRATGKAEADILAHVAYAHFLRYRTGRLFHHPPNGCGDNLDSKVDEQLKEALQIDPENVFGHAVWGAWIAYSRSQELDAANDHFAHALTAADRACRDVNQGVACDEETFVRKLQIDVLTWWDEEPRNLVEAVRVADGMRRAAEPLEDWQRRRLSRVYEKLFDLDSRDDPPTENAINSLVSALPAADGLATLTWVNKEKDRESMIWLRYIEARLTEEAGDRQHAVSSYRSLLSDDGLKDNAFFPYLEKVIHRRLETLTN